MLLNCSCDKAPAQNELGETVIEGFKMHSMLQSNMVLQRESDFILWGTATEGVKAIENLKDGDTILISEGCTHHRQCNDIGTVKIPALIRKVTGKDIKFEFTQGHSYMEDLL